MSRVKVRVEGHYEVRELPHAKDYVWEPAHAIVECDRDHELQADSRHTTCPKCGADYAMVVREVEGRHLGEAVIHPWHAGHYEWLEQRELG